MKAFIQEANKEDNLELSEWKVSKYFKKSRRTL